MALMRSHRRSADMEEHALSGGLRHHHRWCCCGISCATVYRAGRTDLRIYPQQQPGGTAAAICHRRCRIACSVNSIGGSDGAGTSMTLIYATE